MRITSIELINSIPQAVFGAMNAFGVFIKYVTTNCIDTIMHLFHKIVPCIPTSTQHRLPNIIRVLHQEGRVVYNRLRGLVTPAEILTERALKNAPNREAYYQVLAQHVSYRTIADNTVLMPSDHFPSPLYEVKKTIRFPEGIKGIVIISEDENEPPMLVFRGTEIGNIDNIMDDFTSNIGEINTTRYDIALRTELRELCHTYGRRIHIMGHSYGGTVAKRLTAKYPQFIARCTSYNSPKVGIAMAQEYYKNVANLRHRPQIWSYSHIKDPVRLVGGADLPTTPGRNYILGSLDDDISYIEAHSLNTLSMNVQSVADEILQPVLQEFSENAERWRQQISRVFTLYNTLRPRRSV